MLSLRKCFTNLPVTEGLYDVSPLLLVQHYTFELLVYGMILDKPSGMWFKVIVGEHLPGKKHSYPA